jgi:hypothetical protein
VQPVALDAATAEPDPNADLIGQLVEIAGQTHIVLATWQHSVQYVVLEAEDNRTIIKAAGLVRRHIELTGGKHGD